jgi:hypothetical protein
MMRQFDDPDQAVSIAAIFLFIGAALQAPQLLQILFTEASAFAEPLVLLLVVLPVVTAVAGGYGLLKGKRWGWPVALVAAVLSIVQTLLLRAGGGPLGALSLLLGLLIDGFLIYLLFRPSVRARFGVGQR